MKTLTQNLRRIILLAGSVTFLMVSCRNNETPETPVDQTLKLKTKIIPIANGPLVEKGEFFAVKNRNSDAIFLHSNSWYTTPADKYGFWVVNLENGSFSPKPKNSKIMGAGISSTIGTDGSFCYYYGGNSDFIRYNIASETWENYKDYSPQSDFYNNGSIMLNNKYYFIYRTNDNVNNPIATFETLSKTWSFSDIPAFPMKIDWYGAMVSDNNRYIYHLGGATDNPNGGPSIDNKSVYRLDTSLKKWEKISDINFSPNTNRYTNTTCIFKNKYLTALDSSGNLQLFDLEKKTWQTVNLNIQGYYNMALFSATNGEKIYLLGTKAINNSNYNYELLEISE